MGIILKRLGGVIRRMKSVTIKHQEQYLLIASEDDGSVCPYFYDCKVKMYWVRSVQKSIQWKVSLRTIVSSVFLPC